MSLSLLKSVFSDENKWSENLMLGVYTGCTAFDVTTSSIEKDIYRNKNVMNGGLFPQIYTFVGDSGTGKSSLILQFIGGALTNLAARYDDAFGECIYIDNEGHTTGQRFSALNGWSEMDVAEKLYLDKETFDPTDVYNLIRKVVDGKAARRKELTIYSKMSTLDNKLHKVLAPTYIVIDSVANMSVVPDFEHNKYGELKDMDKVVGNMDGMRDAKNNTNLLKKVKPLMVEYNLTLILVNHFVDKPAVDQFEAMRQTKALPWMDKGKTLKGGIQMFFQTAYLPRLKYSRDHSKEQNLVYGNSVHGQINNLALFKNKNGIEAIEFPLVFDSSKGYMFELSDFEYLMDRKYGVQGSGTYYLDILPEIRFKRNQLYDDCQENPLIARAIQFTAKLHMIYKWVKHIEPPDMSIFSNLPFEERVKLIVTFTDDYPKYKSEGKVLRKEHIDIIRKAKIQYRNSDKNQYVNDNILESVKSYSRGLSGFTNRISLQDVVMMKKKLGKKFNKNTLLFSQVSEE